MRKHLILAFSLYAPLHCMEQPLITHKSDREPREWDAQAYDEGNKLQTSTFLHFLKTYNIKTEQLTILDVGCGTGKITAQLAEKATHIHGFDASKNMIDFARNKYGHLKNVSFEHAFAEDFTSPNLKQLALASYCIHWFEDKKQAFQRIHDSLEIGGEFFATIKTSDNPLPMNLIVATEMMPLVETMVSFATGKSLLELIGSSYPSHEEFNAMLCETGFEIIKSEEQSFDCIMDEDELRKLQWPIVSSRPIVKYIPDIFVQSLFENFMNRYIEKLPKTNNGKFLEKIFTTIIHARKIKNDS